MSVAADVAVVGAGTSGLSAATAAAKSGAEVHVLDAGPSPKHPARGRATRWEAFEKAVAAGVHVHFDAEIWAIFPERTLYATKAGRPLEVVARSIIIASGARDHVVPFPGWTLPGVVTAGDVRRLARIDRSALGKRVVVTGSGPAMFAAARDVVEAGASLAGYVEAQRIRARFLFHIARSPERWCDTLRLLLAAERDRARLRSGWIVTEALGGERIEAVRIAPTALGGEIVEARSEIIYAIDALIIGWGSRPSIELSALLGCRHAFDESRGGWYCVADATTGRTSVASVYAAGDVAGVAGALSATLSGRMAGEAAAADLGFTLAPTQGRASALRSLRKARAGAATRNRLFAAPGVLGALATDDTIICRCEDVTLGTVRAAIVEGANTVPGVKRFTRAGMGPCQGRMCGWAVAQALGHDERAQAGFNRPRIPVRPVPLSIIMQALDGTSRSMPDDT